MKFKILVVDSDFEIRETIALILAEMDFLIELASAGPEAIHKIKSDFFHLLVLNQVLPDMSGIEVIRRVREFKAAHELAILVMSGDRRPESQNQLFEAGASDFIIRPFERNDFLGKVETMLRQFHPETPHEKPGQIILPGLTLHTHSFDVYCGSERIHLTTSEFKLLQALATNRGAILSREKLIAQVQGAGIAVIDRAVDTHIFTLRKKLGANGEVIETVRGEGYRIQ